MKIYAAPFLIALTCATLRAQEVQVPATRPQPGSAPGLAGAVNRPPTPTDITAMRIQLNHKLSAEMQLMESKLNQMKMNAGTAKDPAVKKQLQLETEMWEMTLSHLNNLRMAMLQIQHPQPDTNRAQMFRQQLLQQRGPSAIMAPQPPRQPVPDGVPPAVSTFRVGTQTPSSTPAGAPSDKQ